MSIGLALMGWIAAGVPLTPVLWAGHLEDAAGPVDGTVSAFGSVTDTATGATLSRIEEPTLPVFAGDFFLDIPVPAPFSGVTVSPVRVELIVNGERFEPFVVEGAWTAVVFADDASRAEQADNASALAGITDPVALASLEGGASSPALVAFANLTGVPAEFLDGDAGLDLAPDASFSFVDGTLTLLARGIGATAVDGLDAADLANDSVDGTKIAVGAVAAADVTAASIPLTALKADGLGATHFGNVLTRVELFEVDDAGCGAPVGTLRTSGACSINGVFRALPSAGFAVFK